MDFFVSIDHNWFQLILSYILFDKVVSLFAAEISTKIILSFADNVVKIPI